VYLVGFYYKNIRTIVGHFIIYEFGTASFNTHRNVYSHMPSSSLIKSLAFLGGVQELHTRDLRGTEPL